MPERLTVALICPDGHETRMVVPDQIGAEEALLTPEEAPIAVDARLVE